MVTMTFTEAEAAQVVRALADRQTWLVTEPAFADEQFRAEFNATQSAAQVATRATAEAGRIP